MRNRYILKQWRFQRGNALFLSLMAVVLLTLFCGNASAQDSTAAPTGHPNFGTKTVRLTLEETVRLVAKHNRDVKNAFLQRKADTYDLEEAEDTFVPHFSINSSLQQTSDKAVSDLSGSTDKEVRQGLAGAGIETRFKTGASAKLDMNHTFSDDDTDRAQTGTNQFLNTNTKGQTVTLSATQPLLRNAGIAVNTAPVEAARKNDAISALELQAGLNTTLTEAILAFRDLIKAWESIAIEAATLERAEEQQRKIARLIEAGRMAPFDLIQTEAEISTNRFKLIQAKNNFEASQLELNKLLDVDTGYRVMPQSGVIAEHVPLKFEVDLATALANSPAYLQAEHRMAVGKLQVLTTANNRWWNLDLKASYSKTFEDERITGDAFSDDDRSDREYKVGLILSHTFGDVSRDRQYHQARMALKQAENALQNVKDNIRIEVANSIRNIDLTYQAYQVAQKARELTEKKLEVEMKKLENGRSSAFTVPTFKNDAARASTDELNAAIDYVNALTRYDNVLGITWKKWGVSLERDIK